jgi:hypothetical protein
MAPAAEHVPAWRRALSSRLVKIALSVCLLILLRTDLSDLFGVVRTNLGWVLVALALYVISQVVSAWRWMTLAGGRHALPFDPFFRAYFTSVHEPLAPSTVAGDIGRALLSPPASAAGVGADNGDADRALGFVVLVFIGAWRCCCSPDIGCRVCLLCILGHPAGDVADAAVWPAADCARPRAGEVGAFWSSATCFIERRPPAVEHEHRRGADARLHRRTILLVGFDIDAGALLLLSFR